MAHKDAKSAKVTFLPSGDRVLVKPDLSQDEKSPSGIIIPDSAKHEKPETGIVVAVGVGKRNDAGELIPVGVKIGDKVMFSKYGFDEVMLNEEEHYVISESSILGVFK